MMVLGGKVVGEGEEYNTCVRRLQKSVQLTSLKECKNREDRNLGKR